MTNSRSSISINKLLIVIATLVLWVGSAKAERRRVVVLEFEGPKAEKFHDDVVKLLKKSHTVISVEKWNGAAEELDAAKVTAKNVKKIAKKLKVDGVVTGIIEKRRDEYIIRLKLRAGTSGETTGNSVQTKAEGPRLDGQAQRDIKEELIGAIDELDANRGGSSDDEEEDAPKKKKKGGDEEEEETDAPKKSGFSRKGDKAEDEEDEPAKEKPLTKKEKKAKAEEEKRAKAEEEKRAKAEAKLAAEEEAKAKKDKKKKKTEEADEETEALATKKDKGDDEEEDSPKSKKRAKSADDEEGDEDGGRKKKASADDEGEEEDGISAKTDEDDADTATKLSPANRAIDAVVGLSFTARKLKFTYQADLGKAPPGYKQSVPVAGAMIDLTGYPMAFGHKNKSITSNIGVNVLYDQVIKINSQKRYADGAGMQQIANLATKESRWAFGGVFRYPLGSGPKAMVLGGRLTYGRQQFTVEQTLPNGDKTDIPNVHYSMITPAAFFQFPVTPKIIFNLEAAFLLITNTGAIQNPDQYGAATVTGFEFDTGIDYMLLKNVFVRAAFRYETIGFKFKGDPMSQTHTRDADPDQDVTGARDSYLGGTATLGYLY